MNRDAAIALLDRLHAAQNEFLAGGSGAPLEQLLAPDITWSGRIAACWLLPLDQIALDAIWSA